MKRLLTVLALVAALSAASSAEDKVDRERLRKALPLPTVQPQGWYYSVSLDGRVWEPGQEPAKADVEVLRARIKDDGSDAQGWMDLAAAYRRRGDATQQSDCIGHAVDVLRVRAANRADDGEPLAALGLSLAAAGDDRAADDAVARAEKAAQRAWAGTAASANLLVLRSIAKAAGQRFGTIDEAGEWIEADRSRAARVDVASIDTASKRLDDAVAALETGSIRGRGAAAVHLARMSVLALRDGCSPRGEAMADRRRRLDDAARDHRKALELLAPDPLALTMLALDDAMTAPPDIGGNRHAQTFDKLDQAARAKLGESVAKLRSIATSAEPATSARALQGLACLQWFVLDNNSASEARLREAIARDPGVRGSWTALAFVLYGLKRWDDLAKHYDEWIAKSDASDQRTIVALHGMAAAALAAGGRLAESEQQSRAALALDPKSPAANISVASLVLRRTTSQAEVTEAARLLTEANAELSAQGSEANPSMVAACFLAVAVGQALSDDLDACEKTVRFLLEKFGDIPQAREVLAAIGR